MKHLKFVKFLVLAVLGLGLGFTSCDDEDSNSGGSSTTMSDVYNQEAVNQGIAFYGAYENAPDVASKVLAAAPYAMVVMQKKDDKVYESSFWVGVAAAKFGYTDNLDKAAQMVDQLGDIKDIWASASTTPEGSESAN